LLKVFCIIHALGMIVVDDVSFHCYEIALPAEVQYELLCGKAKCIHIAWA
jgi:hypothetical protein